MNLSMPADRDATEPMVMEFHGQTYAVLTLGSLTPRRLLSSFAFEKEIRDKYWHPKKGDVVPIPQQIRQRMLLFPPWESTWGSPDVIRNDNLVARVQEVTPGEIRLRLEGSVLSIEESSHPLGHVFKPKSQIKPPATYQSKAMASSVGRQHARLWG